MSLNTENAILSNALKVDTSYKVGIGLTNPQRLLEVYSTTPDSHIRISGAAPSVSMGEAITGSIYQAKFGLATASGQYVSGSAAGDFVMASQTGATIFATVATERMRLTTSGNVGIGTSSPNTKLQVEDGFISTYHNINANGAGYGIQFYTNGGGSKNTIGEIGISQEGTARSATMIFSTSNAGSPTERMRITSGGNVGIGTTAPSASLDIRSGGPQLRVGISGGGYIELSDNQISAKNSSNAASNLFINVSGANTILNRDSGNVGIGTSSVTDKLTVDGAVKSYGTSSGLFMSNRNSVGDSFGFFTQGTLNVYTTVSGIIGTFNGTNGVYTPSSDVNRKKDFEASVIGLKEVLQLKPTLYRMKDDDESMPRELGFIAQEVKEFIPQAFVQSGDFIGLNFNAIVAALTKAIQEQQAQIEAQQQQINSLINR